MTLNGGELVNTYYETISRLIRKYWWLATLIVLAFPIPFLRFTEWVREVGHPIFKTPLKWLYCKIYIDFLPTHGRVGFRTSLGTWLIYTVVGSYVWKKSLERLSIVLSVVWTILVVMSSVFLAEVIFYYIHRCLYARNPILWHYWVFTWLLAAFWTISLLLLLRNVFGVSLKRTYQTPIWAILSSLCFSTWFLGIMRPFSFGPPLPVPWNVIIGFSTKGFTSLFVMSFFIPTLPSSEKSNRRIYPFIFFIFFNIVCSFLLLDRLARDWVKDLFIILELACLGIILWQKAVGLFEKDRWRKLGL